jgi:four helix bundle protein
MIDETVTNKLMVLEKADELAHRIYASTRTFPEEEFLGLTLQLRKIALTIPVQILEGIHQQDRKYLKRAFHQAIGRIAEIQYLLRFSFRLRYLSRSTYEELKQLHAETDNLLWRFYNAF